VPGRQPRATTYGAPWTVSTGQAAARTTWWVVDPNLASPGSPRPRRPHHDQLGTLFGGDPEPSAIRAADDDQRLGHPRRVGLVRDQRVQPVVCLVGEALRNSGTLRCTSSRGSSSASHSIAWSSVTDDRNRAHRLSVKRVSIDVRRILRTDVDAVL
jgi:hypothetical protein